MRVFIHGVGVFVALVSLSTAASAAAELNFMQDELSCYSASNSGSWVSIMVDRDTRSGRYYVTKTANGMQSGPVEATGEVEDSGQARLAFNGDELLVKSGEKYLEGSLKQENADGTLRCYLDRIHEWYDGAFRRLSRQYRQVVADDWQARIATAQKVFHDAGYSVGKTIIVPITLPPMRYVAKTVYMPPPHTDYSQKTLVVRGKMVPGFPLTVDDVQVVF